MAVMAMMSPRRTPSRRVGSSFGPMPDTPPVRSPKGKITAFR